MRRQSSAHTGRDPQRVDIGPEGGDPVFGNSEIFFDFFQVAAVKMLFGFQQLFFRCIHKMIPRLSSYAPQLHGALRQWYNNTIEVKITFGSGTLV